MKILQVVTSLKAFAVDLEEEAKRLKERHLKEIYGEHYKPGWKTKPLPIIEELHC